MYLALAQPPIRLALCECDGASGSSVSTRCRFLSVRSHMALAGRAVSSRARDARRPPQGRRPQGVPVASPSLSAPLHSQQFCRRRWLANPFSVSGENCTHFILGLVIFYSAPIHRTRFLLLCISSGLCLGRGGTLRAVRYAYIPVYCPPLLLLPATHISLILLSQLDVFHKIGKTYSV